MPIYDAERFIGVTIASILQQTFTDFELIIIDDGSKDKTGEIAKNFAKIDSRIKYFHQENRGAGRLAETINEGIKHAKADLIARADADDMWFDDKLEKQIDFLDKNPEYVLVGTGAEMATDDGHFKMMFLKPLDHEDIVRSLTIYNTFVHSAIIIRREALEKAGGYKNAHSAEDLALWQKVAKIGKLYNIPQALVQYRIAEEGISNKNSIKQKNTADILYANFFKENPPKFYGFLKISSRLKTLKKLKLSYGEYKCLKFKLLDDTRRIGFVYIQNGRMMLGASQVVVITFFGPVGLFVVARASIKSILNKLGYKR